MQIESSNVVLENRIIGQDALTKLAAVHGKFAVRRRDGRRVILRSCTLTGLDFQGMCFAEAHFIGCNFGGANLTDADFTDAQLFGSRFDRANLTRANFLRADVRAVVFDEAILDDTRFDRADLRKGELLGNSSVADIEAYKEIRSSFRNANLAQTNLSQATLRDVDFTGAILEDARFEGADLRGAQFVGADLKRVVLKNSRLQGADFSGASLEDVDLGLADVLVTGVTPMVAMEEGAVLRVLSDHKTWAETNGNEGRRADFTETNLSGRDLSNRNLSAMSFSGSNLKSIDFRESILAACNFSNANLRAANLSRADLRGAVFQWAVLQDACLAGARIGILPGTGLETVFPDGFALETDSPSPLPPRPEPP